MRNGRSIQNSGGPNWINIKSIGAGRYVILCKKKKNCNLIILESSLLIDSFLSHVLYGFQFTTHNSRLPTYLSVRVEGARYIIPLVEVNNKAGESISSILIFHFRIEINGRLTCFKLTFIIHFESNLTCVAYQFM